MRGDDEKDLVHAISPKKTYGSVYQRSKIFYCSQTNDNFK